MKVCRWQDSLDNMYDFFHPPGSETAFLKVNPWAYYPDYTVLSALKVLGTCLCFSNQWLCSLPCNTMTPSDYYWSI